MEWALYRCNRLLCGRCIDYINDRISIFDLKYQSFHDRIMVTQNKLISKPGDVRLTTGNETL